jgi:hypothetical protein
MANGIVKRGKASKSIVLLIKKITGLIHLKIIKLWALHKRPTKKKFDIPEYIECIDKKLTF